MKKLFILLSFLIVSLTAFNQNIFRYPVIDSNDVTIAASTFGNLARSPIFSLRNNYGRHFQNFTWSSRNFQLKHDSVSLFTVSTADYPDGLLIVDSTGGTAVLGDYATQLNGTTIQVQDRAGLINLVSPVQGVICAANVKPQINATYDLGSSGEHWDTGFIDHIIPAPTVALANGRVGVGNASNVLGGDSNYTTYTSNPGAIPHLRVLNTTGTGTQNDGQVQSHLFQSYALDGFYTDVYMQNGGAGNLVFSLPPNDGDNNDVLSTNGSGTLSWVSPVLTDKTTLSSAQILDLFDTPVELIPAPGAGKIIQVLSVYGKMNFLTAAYATNTNLIIYSATSASPIWSEQTVLLPAAANARASFGAGSTAVAANSPLMISVDAGDPTGGGGSLDVYVTYKIITE